MITSLFVDIFFNFGMWIFDFLPRAEMPEGALAVMAVMNNAVNYLNSIFPMDTFFEIFGIIATIELALLSYRLAIKLYNAFRGSGVQ